ncbi:MAG TPA: hypothetical protein VN108_11750, partial [Marmoricola sp.]|nr:hypothetical protein [Marmoricola sp.]
MTGPTVEGSIVAKVKADISNLEENISLAEAKIEELTGRKPDVTVKANVDTALTKLQAVEAATDRASTANVRLVAAVKALEVAESSEYRRAAVLLPARREATEALRSARNASLELAAAQEALSLEQDKATASARRLNAQAGPRGFFQVALIAVAALLPLLGSLTVYLATVSGAFVGMAGAGILAFVGIRKEMASGTDVGKQYSAGIATIKADFDALSRTAAVTLLSDFRSAVYEINQAMPDLNSQTAQLTTILGAIGGNLLQAVISGLKVLNPLFVQGGAYVNDLAKGLLAWTQNGGLERFVSFARTNFPQIASMLGNLASSTVKIVTAMAPIGTVVIGALNLLTGVINSLPLGMLTQIVAAATGAFLAFKAWSIVAPGLVAVAQAVGAVGVATQIAEGPIGVVTAVIGGLAAILAVAATSSNDATQAEQNYTAAIDASSGAIDKNVKKIAAKALLDDGSLAAAKKLGISTSLLVDATTGNAEAQLKLQQQLAAVNKQLIDGPIAEGQASAARRGATNAISAQVNALDTLSAGYALQSGAIQKTIAD